MIEFRNVSKTYKTGIDALQNVSFKVVDGEFVFVIGRSGSGKSTLIKLLTCEENPTSGHVYIDEYEISFLQRSLIPYLRRNIGMIFQDFRLIYSKTVYENVAFAMEIIGASSSLISTRVPIVLSVVGLRDKALMKPNQLSGGEQQRVAIARAMVNNPMLILADEPTGNLDPENSESIMALLEEINSGGTTILVCTHDSGIVNKMRRRVIEIADGYMVRDDKLGEYNLAMECEKSKNKKKTKNSKNDPCETKKNISSSKKRQEPFVRNINIKFSDEEKVESKIKSSPVDSTTYKCKDIVDEVLDIKINENDNLDNRDNLAEKSKLEENLTKENTAKENTAKENMAKESITKENISEAENNGEEVDFLSMIKPKRVSVPVKPEEIK